MRGTFVRVASNGDICIKSPRTVCNSPCDYDIKYTLPSEISIVESRYDPCRKFKKGDIVVPKLVNGRSFSEQLDPLIGEKCVVECDEEIYNLVDICHDNRHYDIDPAYLELDTPVDVLEPYSVKERTEFSGDEMYGVIHIYYNYNGDRDKVRTFYENGPESWNATKAAAKAECDRLNAEYRKEHNNEHT